MMREYLVAKYPNTYSLPGETEIKQQINAYVQNDKKGQVGKSRKKQEYWFGQLDELVKNNKVAPPEAIYNMLVRQLTQDNNDNATLPEKPEVKRKIGALKSKYKNIAYHAIL